MDFIFKHVRQTAKSAKILTHENFPLYGMLCVCVCVMYIHINVQCIEDTLPLDMPMIDNDGLTCLIFTVIRIKGKNPKKEKVVYSHL